MNARVAICQQVVASSFPTARRCSPSPLPPWCLLPLLSPLLRVLSVRSFPLTSMPRFGRRRCGGFAPHTRLFFFLQMAVEIHNGTTTLNGEGQWAVDTTGVSLGEL